MAKTNIGLKKLLTALSPDLPNDQPASPLTSQLNSLSRYSQAELIAMVNQTYTPRSNRSFSGAPDMTNLISYLRPEHEEIANVIRDSDKFKALAPEIEQAKSILVSSIVSPNDLQECEPTFSLPELKEITIEQSEEICKVLKEYFNGPFELGLKLAEWCEEALFRSGAQPILVLPHAMIESVIQTNDTADHTPTENLLQPKTNEPGSSTQIRFGGKESWDKAQLTYKTLLNESIYGGGLYGTESMTDAQRTEYQARQIQRANTIWHSVGLPDQVLNDSDTMKALESITARFTTDLANGDVFKISENPEVLRFGKVQKEKQKSEIAEAIDRRYRNVQRQHIVSLLDHMDALDEETKGHPFFMELPAEAVIPICVPGDERKRLGYFVLIDAFGQPVEASKYLSDPHTGKGNNTNLNAAYKAMFGGAPSSVSRLPSSLTTFGNPWDLQKHTLTRVFDFVLDNMLKQKLQNIGLGDVDIGKMNSISACMLYRYLEGKQTSLVYVPESMLTYFCFDYRDNGTGKSKLEDVHFILSLRITLLVASIISMMKNATAKRTIEITVDENTASLEQVMTQVQNAYVQKNKYNFPTDPSTVASNIISQNLTIVPKGMAGITGYDATSSETQSQIVRADTDLLEKLDNMFVTALSVPYAALNQLGDNEYSRSVATTNIFFAKNIKRYQKISRGHMTHMARNYVRYSKPLLDKIRYILQGTKTAPDNSVKTSDGKSTNIDLLVRKIVSSIEISLPSPNIAPDKARFAEIREYIGTINELIDGAMQQELVPSTDTAVSETFAVFKALAKANAVRDFIGKVGALGDYTIPSVDELADAHEGLIEFYQALRNAAMATKQSAAIQQPADTGGDGFGGSSDSNFGSSGTDDGYGGYNPGGDNTNNTSETEETPTDQNNPSAFPDF